MVPAHRYLSHFVRPVVTVQSAVPHSGLIDAPAVVAPPQAGRLTAPTLLQVSSLRPGGLRAEREQRSPACSLQLTRLVQLPVPGDAVTRGLREAVAALVVAPGLVTPVQAVREAVTDLAGWNAPPV